MLRGVEDLRLLGFLGFRSPLASGSLKERCIWPRVSRKERGAGRVCMEKALETSKCRPTKSNQGHEFLNVSYLQAQHAGRPSRTGEAKPFSLTGFYGWGLRAQG